MKKINLLTGALMTGLLTAGTAGSATARSEPVTNVPKHLVVPPLKLLGASEAGVVVRVGAETVLPQVFTGAEGGTLTARPELRTRVDSMFTPPIVTGVDGTTLAWAEQLPGAGTRFFSAHQMNLLTGKDEPQGSMPLPQGYSGGGVWVSDRRGSLSNFPPAPPALKTYTKGANPGMDARTVLTENDETLDLVVHGDTALRSSYRSDGEVTVYDLALIDLTDGAVTTLVDDGPDRITAIALGEGRVGWVTGALVHERSGDTVNVYSAGDLDVTRDDLVAGAGSLAYLSTGGNLEILAGGSKTEVRLPEGADGLVPVGGAYLTAARGSQPGVYRITADRRVVRTTTGPAVEVSPQTVAAAGGRVHYGDQLGVWSRRISGENHPRLGPETRLGDPALAIAFSAGRGAVTRPDGTATQLLDGGRPVAVVPDVGRPNVSGAYTLLGRAVYGPDGAKVFTVPSAEGLSDLYGSRVVWSETDGSTARIMLGSIEAGAEPVEVGTSSPCAYAPKVSVWGQTVAWSTCDDRSVVVLDTKSGARRTVPVPASLGSVTLGEGTLALVAGSTAYTLDLTGPVIAPTALPGITGTLALDDHWVVRRLYDSFTVQRAEVRTLPSPAKLRPRLISSGVATEFDRSAAPGWHPRFDVSKPLRGVTLKLADPAGVVVATLSGSGDDGSVRDLVWDGRNRKGVPVGAGTYTWTLTGRAADGTLMNVDGGDLVKGTVAVR